MKLGKREATRLRDLLLMRDCAKGSPSLLARRIRDVHGQKISQKGAGKKIQSLEENGYILGYTPIVDPSHFGEPYLVTITFDESYRDVPSYIEVIESFLETMENFAVITSCVLNAESIRKVICVVLTRDIESFNRSLMNVAALDDHIVAWNRLHHLQGIPKYSNGSVNVDALGP